MSITLDLSLETEQRLRERAAQEGKSLEIYLGLLAQNWVGHNGAPGPQKAQQEKPLEQWLSEFRAWIASHKPISTFVDDSRESIYNQGCAMP